MQEYYLEAKVGGGAFGNVYKAINRENPSILRAAKVIDMEDSKVLKISCNIYMCVCILRVSLFDCLYQGNYF